MLYKYHYFHLFFEDHDKVIANFLVNFWAFLGGVEDSNHSYLFLKKKVFLLQGVPHPKKCNLNEMLHEKSRWGFLFTHFMGVFVTSLTKVYVLKNRCSSCLQEHHHTCLISFLNTLFPLRVNYIVLNCQKHQLENTR